MQPSAMDAEIGEYLVPGEAEIIAGLVGVFQNHHFRHHHEAARRAIHVKSHGRPRARFEVLDQPNPDLRYGCSPPPTDVVRLSNATGPPGPNTDRTVSLGFAVEVFGVTAPELLPERTERAQDLHFPNPPAYISADVRSYAALSTSRAAPPITTFSSGIAFATAPRTIRSRGTRRRSSRSTRPGTTSPSNRRTISSTGSARTWRSRTGTRPATSAPGLPEPRGGSCPRFPSRRHEINPRTVPTDAPRRSVNARKGVS